MNGMSFGLLNWLFATLKRPNVCQNDRFSVREYYSS
ncbi:MAG: hypothetical protein ACI8VW_004059 [bacterium]